MRREMSMLVDAEIAKSVLEEDPSKALASTCIHAYALKERLDSREAMKAALWRPPAIDPIVPPSRNMNMQPLRGAHLKPCISELVDRFLHRLHRNPVPWQQGDTATYWFSVAPRVLLTGLHCGGRPIRLGAPTRVPQHRAGSTALPLRSSLSNVNHHFGGQL